MYKIKADTQRNILTQLRTRKYSFPCKSCQGSSSSISSLFMLLCMFVLFGCCCCRIHWSLSFVWRVQSCRHHDQTLGLSDDLEATPAASFLSGRYGWPLWGLASLRLHICYMLQDYKPMGSDKIYTGMSISGFLVESEYSSVCQLLSCTYVYMYITSN